MKRIIALLLVLLCLLLGCCLQRTSDVTREDIVAAYRAEGYGVYTEAYDEPYEFGEVAYIQANHPDGDYIYIAFFETPEQARTYMQEQYHPIAMTLFLSIYAGRLYIPKWKVHGNMVVQYENPDFYEPLRDLIF